jgi:hypothetical protein
MPTPGADKAVTPPRHERDDTTLVAMAERPNTRSSDVPDEPAVPSSASRHTRASERVAAPDRAAAPEPVVDPSLVGWEPPAPPTPRQRARSGALAAAMLAVGDILEPSKRREEAPIEAEAPGEPDDGYELRFDPDDPTRLTVVVRRSGGAPAGSGSPGPDA